MYDKIKSVGTFTSHFSKYSAKLLMSNSSHLTKQNMSKSELHS